MTDLARQFRCEVDPDPPLVRVFGDVDIDSRDVLAATIRDLLEGRDGATVVLDLAGVTFLDSSGLAVLAGVLNSGHGLTIRNPPPIVQRIIEATGLDDVVHVDP
jgi:anti-anti-sigma factor